MAVRVIQNRIIGENAVFADNHRTVVFKAGDVRVHESSAVADVNGQVVFAAEAFDLDTDIDMDVITEIQQAVVGVKSQVTVGVAIKVFADSTRLLLPSMRRLSFSRQAKFSSISIMLLLPLMLMRALLHFEFLRQFDCIVFTVVADTEFAQQLL